MNIRYSKDFLKKLMDKYSQLKETQHLKQVMSFQESRIKNQKWLYDIDAFIASIWNSYPTLQYSIGKYQNGFSKVVDFQTMNDYLMMAGLCITDELLIEVYKKK